MNRVLQAIGFLTVLPIPRRSAETFSPSAAMYFPLVGLLIGILLAAGDLAVQTFPLLVRSILVVGLWLVVTGALHLDGWIDACDAMAPGLSPEKARAAMRDPRAGAMGVGGAFLLLATKWAALTSLVDSRGVWIILAALTGRWVVSMMLVLGPSDGAQEGLGAQVAGGLHARHAFVASSIMVLSLSFIRPLTWAVAIAACCIACGALALMLRRRVGSLTGDGYGAMVELSEVLVLLLGAAGMQP